MKKIFFLLFSKNIEGKEFALKETNPGVGGTQFTTINTALGLGLFVPDWQIILVNYSPVNIKDPPANLEQVFYDTPQDFFKQYSQNSSSLIVATVAIISQVPITLIQPLSECLILWSHHPFDLGLKNILKSISIKAVVCPGIYQSFSNQTLTSKICHIQNIFTLPTIDHFPADHSLNRKQINLVHLSALGPAKGFLDIAKSWQPLKTRFPNIKLHVIGSSATYGQESESTIVPTSSDFATQILKFIPQEDIAAGHVIFYGNLGREKFDIMRECDLAILNPKGYTEAFPASPLEMLACGVPVIASDDYGMSDCMRFFPELIINGHKDILSRVEYVVDDLLRYRELQERSIAVAHWFSDQTDLILIRWLRLINSFFEEEKPTLCLPPTMPFYGSKSSFVYRGYVKPRLATVKRFLTRGH